jgi:hypothetical protein
MNNEVWKPPVDMRPIEEVVTDLQLAWRRRGKRTVIRYQGGGWVWVRDPMSPSREGRRYRADWARGELKSELLREQQQKLTEGDYAALMGS